MGTHCGVLAARVCGWSMGLPGLTLLSCRRVRRRRCFAATLQALVDHFASVGAPQRVEGVVLHLSIASLDLDQV